MNIAHLENACLAYARDLCSILSMGWEWCAWAETKTPNHKITNNKKNKATITVTAARITTELSSPGFTKENKQVQIIWKVTRTLQATEHIVHLECVLMHKQPSLIKPNKTLSNPNQITLSKKQMKKRKI